MIFLINKKAFRVDTEGLFCCLKQNELLTFSSDRQCSRFGIPEQTATTTGIELDQVEKHGTKVCKNNREKQITGGILLKLIKTFFIERHLKQVKIKIIIGFPRKTVLNS